jgi:hypothetical protein
MKKLLVLFVLLAVFSLSVVVFAEDSGEEIDPVTPEGVVVEENNTLASRVWDFVGDNKSALLVIVGDLSLIVAYLRSYFKNKANNKDLMTALGNVYKSVSGTAQGQKTVSGACNELVETLATVIKSSGVLTEAYSILNTTEESNNRRLTILEKQNQTILEILIAAYSGNKNLPQGIKDIISLKYADCLKVSGGYELPDTENTEVQAHE